MTANREYAYYKKEVYQHSKNQSNWSGLLLLLVPVLVPQTPALYENYSNPSFICYKFIFFSTNIKDNAEIAI